MLIWMLPWKRDLTPSIKNQRWYFHTAVSYKHSTLKNGAAFRLQFFLLSVIQSLCIFHGLLFKSTILAMRIPALKHLPWLGDASVD